MPLRLSYVLSTAPFLDDILAPLIQRHIDFNRRDSFRIVTPDAESRLDLERRFLAHEELGGILIGKSLLTPASLAQSLLLEHPSPRPLASLPAQKKALQLALAELRPEWTLDGPAYRKCLNELRTLRRLADLRARGDSLAYRVDSQFQKNLEENFQSWLPERGLREAWTLLERKASSSLKLVEECWFLGFRMPEPSLLDLISVLAKAYPQMNLRLFLPPPEQFLDPDLKLEPWLRRLESFAEAQERLPAFVPPPSVIQPYATSIHEARACLAQNCGTILTPAFSQVNIVLESEFCAPKGLARGEASFSTQIPAIFLKALEEAAGQEAPLLFSELLTVSAPILRDLQEKCAKNSDLDSLRFLQAFRDWLLETGRAEAVLPERRSLASWLADIKEELNEFRLPLPQGSANLLPMRRLDRAGLALQDTLVMVGLNEGALPSPPSPLFFEEENARFFSLHEEALAFRQALCLAKNHSILSFSQATLSGRALLPSPFLSDLENVIWKEPHAELAPADCGRHPYFIENADRELLRHHDLELGFDSGNLTSLGLSEVILQDLRRHPLSATYLDDYAKCPWRFFARRMLGLKEEPEEDLEIDPRRRGSLMHRLLESVIGQLIRDFFSTGNLPKSDDVASALTESFEELSKDTLAKETPVPRPLVLDQLERLRKSVEILLTEELEAWNEAPEKLIPRYLEWNFGRGGHPSLRIDLAEGLSLPLTGAVDRIDVSEDGTRFLLIDYKSSGSSEYASEIRAGRGLQLWIYLHAVRQLLLPRTEALGALYWDLKEVKKNQGLARREAVQPFLVSKIRGPSKSFLKEEEFADLLSSLEETTQKILHRILQGDFSLKPEQCSGSRCEFREICRYDDKPKN